MCSMISSQCEKLRETASQLENLYNLDRYARDVYLAADTIWELRCKLVGTVDQSEEVDALKAENAKLRELCINMHAWMGRAMYEGSERKYEYESITECMDDLGVPHD